MIKIDLNRWFKSIDLNQIHPGFGSSWSAISKNSLCAAAVLVLWMNMTTGRTGDSAKITINSGSVYLTLTRPNNITKSSNTQNI